MRLIRNVRPHRPSPHKERVGGGARDNTRLVDGVAVRAVRWKEAGHMAARFFACTLWTVLRASLRPRAPERSSFPCPGSSGVEQWIENPRVGGSIPPPGTTFTKQIKHLGQRQTPYACVNQKHTKHTLFAVFLGSVQSGITVLNTVKLLCAVLG